MRIGAIQQSQQYTFRDPLEVYGNTVIVEDFDSSSYVLMVDGKINLDAYSGVTIYNQLEARDYDIALYSATGKIWQKDPTNNLDGAASEPLRAKDLNVQAGGGIALPWAQINTLTAVNTGDGDININVVARDSILGIGGDVRVDRIAQTHASGGNITLTTDGGTITVNAAGQGVSTVSGGEIKLTAGGSGKQIVVNKGISGTTGAITLTAPGSVINTDDATSDGTITTLGGSISLIII